MPSAKPFQAARSERRGAIVRVGTRRYFRDHRGVYWRVQGVEGMGLLVVGKRERRHADLATGQVSGPLPH